MHTQRNYDLQRRGDPMGIALIWSLVVMLVRWMFSKVGGVLVWPNQGCRCSTCSAFKYALADTGWLLSVCSVFFYLVVSVRSLWCVYVCFVRVWFIFIFMAVIRFQLNCFSPKMSSWPWFAAIMFIHTKIKHWLSFRLRILLLRTETIIASEL